MNLLLKMMKSNTKANVQNLFFVIFVKNFISKKNVVKIPMNFSVKFLPINVYIVVKLFIIQIIGKMNVYLEKFNVQIVKKFSLLTI